MTINIVGIYKIKSRIPCHLVELIATDLVTPLEVGLITQKQKSRPKDEWQVAYKETLFNLQGDTMLSEEWEMIEPVKLSGSFRLVFYFHYLHHRMPMSTQYGEIPIPEATKLPQRLNTLNYTEPD